MRCLVVLFVLTAATAAIVDRVEIAVGNRVITRSDIELRIRLTAFQNRQPVELSLRARQDAAKKLVDQRLIEREMEVGHYPRIGDAAAGALVGAFEKLNYPAGRESMLTALSSYGLAELDLRTDLARQADVLSFLSLRFRPAVDVGDDEVKKYFDEKLGAAAQQPGLAALRSQIEEILTNERADRDMETWLDDSRKRTKIEYPDAELAETAK